MLTHQNPVYTSIYVFCCKVMYFFSILRHFCLLILFLE